MASSEQVRARVRRAYERSRLVDGLLATWPVPVLWLIASVLHSHLGVGAIVTGIALAAVLGVATWRGRSWRRGALAGMFAGLLPLVVPALTLGMRGETHCAGCTPAMGNVLACTVICSATALVAGVAVGLRAARDASPVRFAAAALAVAALVGLIACGAIGAAGSAGIVLGVALGGIPAVALARRATS